MPINLFTDQVSVERIVLDLESEGPSSIPTRGNIFFSKFYNLNLHNTARSDSLGFKTKNPIMTDLKGQRWTLSQCQHSEDHEGPE